MVGDRSSLPYWRFARAGTARCPSGCSRHPTTITRRSTAGGSCAGVALFAIESQAELHTLRRTLSADELPGARLDGRPAVTGRASSASFGSTGQPAPRAETSTNHHRRSRGQL